MSDIIKRTAIVLDTNFIIEHIKDLKEVFDKLSEQYDVYVTEISINERISQKYLDLKAKYDKIESFQKEYSAYTAIKIKKTFEDRFEAEKKYTIKGYEELFGDKIIRFNAAKDALKTVMDRVYKKIPPFLNVDNASDKGFKDTLLWLAILDFFKDEKDDVDVVFITNDKGFAKYIDILQKEFIKKTNKNIDIKNNTYYKELLGENLETKKVEEERTKELSVAEKSELRLQIKIIIHGICNVIKYDEYGEEYWRSAFITNTQFDNEKTQNSFENMNSILADHILESEIKPSIIWGSDFLIQDLEKIPLEKIELAVELYKKVKLKYCEYITSFFNATCEIINTNYREYIEDIDDDLPF